MKADLAIYSHAVDATGQCMSKSLILGHNLDFSSCDILVGFVNSVTNVTTSITDTSYHVVTEISLLILFT